MCFIVRKANRITRLGPFRGTVICCLIVFCLAGCQGENSPADTSSSGVTGSDSAPPVRAASDDGTWEVTPSELRARLRANEMAKFRMSGNKVIRAELFQSGISSIDALKGLPLEFLDIGMTDVADLSVIAGMPLKEIVLEKTPVSDISVLRGMPLEVVKLQSTQVTDLSPLYEMKLRQLNLMDIPVSDLTPFAQMPLETLWIPGTKVTDLTPLTGTKTLISLDLQGTGVSKLDPISGLTGLKRLNIAGTGVEDLTPLKDLQLERLTLTPQTIRSGMDVIRNMKSLVDIQPSIDAPMSAADFWKRYDLGVWPVPASE